MPLDHVELKKPNVPDNPQIRARLVELTWPGGMPLQPAETYEARDPAGLDTTVLRQRGGDDEICVAQSVDATACNGDSGTPAIVDGKVVAVTSRGPIGPCGGEGWIVYTAVAPHQQWIEKTIATN